MLAKPMEKVYGAPASDQEKHVNQGARQVGGDTIPIYTRKEIQVLIVRVTVNKEKYR